LALGVMLDSFLRVLGSPGVVLASFLRVLGAAGGMGMNSESSFLTADGRRRILGCMSLDLIS
jgi:hypothetical protein